MTTHNFPEDLVYINTKAYIKHIVPDTESDSVIIMLFHGIRY